MSEGMYKRLSIHLLNTRQDFSYVCKQLGIDPEWTDPKLLSVQSCDNCSYWELSEVGHTYEDETFFCKACYNLETLRF